MGKGETRSIETSLNKAREYIDALDDPIQDDFEGSANGDRLEGLACQHGDHTYLVMTAESWDWVLIRYPLSIDQIYAQRKLQSNDSNESTLTDNQVRQAREEMENRLNDMRPEHLKKFRLNLINMLSREGATVSLDTTTPLNIHGFNVGKKAFVHDPHFSLADFDHIKQTIVSLGWAGKEFVIENFGFRPDVPDNQGVGHGGPGQGV